MKMRYIALFVILAMLVPLTSAVAAIDTATRPTVEEIISAYHKEAFESEIAEESENVSTFSRSSSNSEKNLEKQTVDTLNAAGYEAYNITSDNYEILEEQLKTDFSQIGLDPDGSYIIAITGEENTRSNNARIPTPDISIIQPPDGGASTFFEYTYDGKTYYMRYVTVTAKQESPLGRTGVVDLFADYSGSRLINALDLPIQFFTYLTDYCGIPGVISTSYTLLSMISSDAPLNQTASLALTGSANWTIKYLQIWDNQNSSWKVRSSVEFVNKTYSTTYSYYSDQENKYVYEYNSGDLPTEYSDHYYDAETVKMIAVQALLYNDEARYLNKIPSVSIEYNGATVITLTRRSEHLGYEP